MFKRLLIANRGEVAQRIIRSCRELGIETVAVYSEADSRSPHLDQADVRVNIGPGTSRESYLNRENILQAAINTESQAVHPGFGFLAEDALFAEMCEQLKLTFVGPSSQAIQLMGNKSLAKETVKQYGLPVIPGSKGNLQSPSQARKLAVRLGYPVLLKATAGGGGKGIRICQNVEELDAAYPVAALEAEKAFADASLYLEKYIINGRHIEFQLLADSYGRVIHLGERECSLQRKNQKLIEETPSPVVGLKERLKIGKLVCRSAASLGYVNAGTVEFLRDNRGEFYFMEMNTRLQVEHPVTEMVYGIDIVNEQIRIAANHSLSIVQKQVSDSGHAIECRINAEDPANDFQPCPGLISAFDLPLNSGPGRLRVDTHVGAGYEIPPYYDSMICKVIAHGSSRNEAIVTMENALKQFTITGIKTTIPLHRELLQSHEFKSGQYHTGTVNDLIGG